MNDWTRLLLAMTFILAARVLQLCDRAAVAPRGSVGEGDVKLPSFRASWGALDGDGKGMSVVAVSIEGFVVVGAKEAAYARHYFLGQHLIRYVCKNPFGVS